MKIHPAQQGSLDWMMARAGIPTASEWDALLTPEFKIRQGEMPKTYLAKKIAERWTGSPLPGFNIFDCDQGQLLESEAIPFFELETGLSVQRVGLCTDDNGTYGCSPDGLIGDDNGIEVKSPEMHTHVRYLLGGTVPKDYIVQVHGAMFVTGRPKWTFMSYRRHFPPLIVEVQMDENIQEQIAIAIEDFLQAMAEGMQLIEKRNGGPARRRQPTAPTIKQTATDDLIP